MNYKKILTEIEKEIQKELPRGKVANYIPALAEVEPNQFAMTITLKPKLCIRNSLSSTNHLA